MESTNFKVDHWAAELFHEAVTYLFTPLTWDLFIHKSKLHCALVYTIILKFAVSTE